MCLYTLKNIRNVAFTGTSPYNKIHPIFYIQHSPVFYLVGALHRIDVHADLVLNMGRHTYGPRIHVSEDEPSPKLVLLQQVQGLVGHLRLVRERCKLIQVETLQEDKGELRILEGNHICRYLYMVRDTIMKVSKLNRTSLLCVTDGRL